MDSDTKCLQYALFLAVLTQKTKLEWARFNFCEYSETFASSSRNIVYDCVIAVDVAMVTDAEEGEVTVVTSETQGSFTCLILSYVARSVKINKKPSSAF